MMLWFRSRSGPATDAEGAAGEVDGRDSAEATGARAHSPRLRPGVEHLVGMA
jgi:hypothetical protein